VLKPVQSSTKTGGGQYESAMSHHIPGMNQKATAGPKAGPPSTGFAMQGLVGSSLPGQTAVKKFTAGNKKMAQPARVA
jgi:hypothetical protein